MQDVWAEVVRKDDKFQIGSENGRTVVKVFEPRFENQDKEIVAAFAIIIDGNGIKNYTIMTKKQIDISWSHAKTKNVQKEYPDQMAMRTVLNRAAKFFINSSSDNDLLLDAVNETTANEFESSDPKDVTPKDDSLIDEVLNAPAETSEVKTDAFKPDITHDPNAAKQTDIFDTQQE